MSAVKTPANDLPVNAPSSGRNWVLGTGESRTEEWRGTKAEIEEKYALLKAEAEGGSDIAELQTRFSDGRSSLMARFTRDGSDIAGEPPGVTIIEELYAVDIIRDIYHAPYFTTGTYVVTDDQAAFVRLVCENNFTESEIDVYIVANDLSNSLIWAAWTDGMKQLRYHLLHGADSYYETGFEIRQSRYGVKTAQMRQTFTGINAVIKDANGAAVAPELLTDMEMIVDALPAGEWLYKPPSTQFLGRGRWRVEKTWHWALKWSKVYGGTWGL